MGNYKDLEPEFIERTLRLISQYEISMHKYEFAEQFNHTLLINCLLGLIVLPKERTISVLPNEPLNKKLKDEMGIINSTFHPTITNLKDLVIRLRHSIAHFNISVESDDPSEFLIDRIVFKDTVETKELIIASFIPSELVGFLRYFGGWIISNIDSLRSRRIPLGAKVRKPKDISR